MAKKPTKADLERLLNGPGELAPAAQQRVDKFNALLEKTVALPMSCDNCRDLKNELDAASKEIERIRAERNFLKDENDMLKYDLRHCKNKLSMMRVQQKEGE